LEILALDVAANTFAAKLNVLKTVVQNLVDAARERIRLNNHKKQEESGMWQNAHDNRLIDANFANFVALKGLRERNGKSSERLGDGQDVGGKSDADESSDNGSTKHHGGSRVDKNARMRLPF
jgi:hypothetical protein